MSEKKMTKEERIEKIKSLLAQKNGQIDQELKDEIFKATTQRRQDKANSVINDISSANNFDSDKVSEEITKIETPDIVKESIKKTLSSILDPIRTTFMVEVAKYIDAISTEQEDTKTIERTVKAKTVKKIENGRFVSAATGNEGEQLVINPEFKQLLSTGYKPNDIQEHEKEVRERSGNDPRAEDNPFINFLIALEKPEIGTSDSDYLKNYLGGEEPGKRSEKITTTKNIPAGLFTKSFEDIERNVRYIQEVGSKQIVMEGNTYKAQKINSIKANQQTNIPDWKISYREKSKKYYLDIQNNFEYFYNNKITTNSSSYSFVGNTNSSLTQEEKDFLNSVNLSECEEFDNEELYANLIYNNISDIFQKTLSASEKATVINAFTDKHASLVQNIISSFMSFYNKNRLLSPFILPKIDGLEDSDLNKTNLIILNLLTFIPETSEELKQCGKQPHPLNFDLTLELMTKKFNEVGIQTISKKDYCEDITLEKPKNPITESTSIAVAIMLARVVVFENILKSLFILDSHKYSKEILQTGLLSNFLYLKVIETLNKYNIFDSFVEIVQDNYDFFRTNGLISEEDEQDNDTIDSSYLNREKVQEDNKELKILVKAITRRTVGYVRNLIGVSNIEASQTSLLSSLSGDKIYDLPNMSLTNEMLQSNDDIIRNKISRINADGPEESNDFFMLERYIDVSNLYRQQREAPLANAIQTIKNKYSNIKGLVRLDEYQEFLENFLAKDLENIRPLVPVLNRTSTLSIFEYIFNQPKLGIRLVQTSKRSSVEFRYYPIVKLEEQLSNIFDIKDPNIKLDINKVKNKKMYSFFDVSYSDKKVYFYNSFPISEKQIDISFSQLYNSSKNTINDIEETIYTINKNTMLNDLQKQPLYRLLVNKSLMVDKIPNIALFYSNSALSTSAMENLFTSSKNKMLDLLDSAVNIKNYKHKNSTERNGGISAKYKQDLDNMGNPLGGANLDILQFLITTPILILKGLTQVMDPNIAIASQIVNAASAGLLFPKFENNTPVYPGEKVILPTVLASMALLPINLLPPGLGIGPPVTPLPGMLYWALEPLLWKLPFFQNQAANSDAAKRLKDDPAYQGLKIGDTDNFKCDIEQDE
jgi:hypothetical protein